MSRLGAAALAVALLAGEGLAAPRGGGRKAADGPAAASPPAAWLDWIQVLQTTEGALTVSGRPVGAGYNVPPGVGLALAAEGRAVIKLGQEGVVELRGPASFRFVSGRRAGLDLTRGGLLAALPRLSGPFHVQARSMVAAVRGTELFLDVRGPSDLYLCVCSGSVRLSDDKRRGYQRTISGEHHTSWEFKGGGPAGVLETSQDMQGHSDEDLEALRAFLR
ncbi:MAG: FecR domain-containing protein [Elusimicrobia bacterium]|nr:FecR domain-containing protein [Elusimicrobiota bacterium]